MFRTTFQITPSNHKIDHKQSILMLGSCFSENIGAKLLGSKFQVCLNPFGILFNPVSVAQSLDYLSENKLFTEEDLMLFEDRWLSLDHHSRFSFDTPQKTLNAINTAIQEGHQCLKEASTVILTFGTAYHYFHNEKQKVVANCHKIPQKAFEKRYLNIEETLFFFDKMVNTIQQINPQAQIVLTLSPVRHWKDGLVENQKSKANLYLSIQETVEKYEQVSYFPAYELLLDDLRDYRFYKADMLHPNEVAVDYIWERFRGSHLSKESQELINEMQQLLKSIHHRPRFPDSAQHLEMLMKLKIKIKELQAQHPALNFESENLLLDTRLRNRKRKDF